VKDEVSDRASALFLALADIAANQRAIWLADRCGTDEQLRHEVERMLAAVDLAASLPESTRLQISHAGADVPLAPGTVVGDFTIVGPLGAGATGVVYLARQRHPPRTVALKTLRRGLEVSSARRRFEVEAELLGQLQHPGIAQIYASFPGDGQTPPFIAMELVDGPPLTEYAEARGLSRPERIELVARVCGAVQHAHQRGIIHRDLKPPNILVGEDGQPKVLDFGVARVAGTQVSLTTVPTGPGQLVGTLPYMSPEQLQTTVDGTDTRTDVYALGVILFRLLSGRLPFAEDDPPLPELGRRIAFDAPPRLSAIDPSLRGDLETIVACALSKERDRRYASAEALASDLRRYVSGLPIAASADSAWYLLRKQVARYRRALLASAVVGVALVGLATYANFHRARADRTNIELEEQLTTSNIERGRLASLGGNLPVAEELVWRELFRHPDSAHARWTLWELYSREPSLWSRVVHEGGTLTIRFSPDGRMLLAASRIDGLLSLLDASSGQIIGTFTSQSRSGIRRAFFTPDGTRVVAGTEDGSLRVWDVASGELRREMPIAVRGLLDLSIAADGDHVLTVGAVEDVQVWSLRSGQLVTTLAGLGRNLTAVAASPVGTLVVAGSADGTLAGWDLPRGKLLWRARPREVRIRAMAVDPQGRSVASGGADGLLDLVDPTSGEVRRSLRYDSTTLSNVTFDAHGSKLAATGFFRTRIWDLDEPSNPPKDLGGSEGMTDLHFHPHGLALATCNGGSGQARLWDLAADARFDHWTAPEGRITGLAVAPDASWLVTAGVDGVSRWQPGHSARASSIVAGARAYALAGSRDGRWLLTAGEPATAAVWDGRDGRRVFDLPGAASGRAVAFSDDERQVYIGESDGTLATWDWVDGIARGPRRTKSADTEVLALAARGQRVFVAHRNGSVVVRDAQSGSEVRKLPALPASPFSLASSPDAQLLATGTFRGVIYVWEVETGREVHQLKGQSRLVGGVDFSPDGRLLASASRDGSTRLWDVATGRWLATVALREAGAERVRFFPDGRRLAIGYEDGEVEIRDLHDFFRYAAGHADYYLHVLRDRGEVFPRSDEVLEWSRRLLAPPVSVTPGSVGQ
jgi:eukaryotic-like serine/threonine-protein kinase